MNGGTSSAAPGRKHLTSTAQCGQYLTPFFYGAVEEQVYLLCLDAKCKALDCILVQSGDVNSAGISVRKVVRPRWTQCDVRRTRTQPSVGRGLPSEEDKRVTQVIRDALDAVDVLLADHIIVADGDFVSLADDGILR